MTLVEIEERLRRIILQTAKNAGNGAAVKSVRDLLDDVERARLLAPREVRQ